MDGGQGVRGDGAVHLRRWEGHIPQVVPRRRQLLFLSSGRDPDEKRSQVWVIPRTGGEARMAVETEEGASKPAWAPDSKRILYLSKVWTEAKPESDVKVVKRIRYKMNAAGFFQGRRTHLFTASLGKNPSS